MEYLEAFVQNSTYSKYFQRVPYHNHPLFLPLIFAFSVILFFIIKEKVSNSFKKQSVKYIEADIPTKERPKENLQDKKEKLELKKAKSSPSKPESENLKGQKQKENKKESKNLNSESNQEEKPVEQGNNSGKKGNDLRISQDNEEKKISLTKSTSEIEGKEQNKKKKKSKKKASKSPENKEEKQAIEENVPPKIPTLTEEEREKGWAIKGEKKPTKDDDSANESTEKYYK